MKIGAIIRFELKNLRKSFIGFIFFVFLYNLIIFSVYDESMAGAFEAIPENMRWIFGGQDIFTFEGWLAFLYFGWEWLLAYGIYLLSKSANSIAGDIKNGSIDIYLSKPRSRIEYIFGKWCTHVILTLITLLCSIIFAILLISVKFGLDTDLIHWDYLFFTFFWQIFIIISIQSLGILSSASAKHTEAIAYAFAIMVFMFLLTNMSELFDENLQNIKYISVFTYFRPMDLLINHNTDGILRDIAFLSIFSIGCVSIAAIHFKGKDIPV